MPPKPMGQLGLNWLTTTENQREKPTRKFSIEMTAKMMLLPTNNADLWIRIVLCFNKVPMIIKHYILIQKFWPVFTRPFFFLTPFAGHPSSSPLLCAFSPLSPPREMLCSVEQRAQYRAWRGSFRVDLFFTRFGKEIPFRNLREKGSVFENRLAWKACFL